MSIKNLRNNATKYPDVKDILNKWAQTVKKVEWQNLEDVRKIYRDAEAVGEFTVFNIIDPVGVTTSLLSLINFIQTIVTQAPCLVTKESVAHRHPAINSNTKLAQKGKLIFMIA
jgi:Uncharacterized protein conserved in bacteria (DUF2136).